MINIDYMILYDIIWYYGYVVFLETEGTCLEELLQSAGPKSGCVYSWLDWLDFWGPSSLPGVSPGSTSMFLVNFGWTHPRFAHGLHQKYWGSHLLKTYNNDDNDDYCMYFARLCWCFAGTLLVLPTKINMDSETAGRWPATWRKRRKRRRRCLECHGHRPGDPGSECHRVWMCYVFFCLVVTGTWNFLVNLWLIYG